MQPSPRSGTDLVLGAIALLILLSGVLWLGGAISALLSQHKIPHGHFFAGLSSLSDPSNPSKSWHTPVGPPVLYWSVTSLVVGVTGLLAFLGVRLFRNVFTGSLNKSPLKARGLASRSEIRVAASQKSLMKRASTLRPSLLKPKPGDIGYLIGIGNGIPCWASVEDSMLLLGPPRSGKGTNVVIPMILDAPGSLVTTSTRPDNLAVTFDARKKRGPVAIFDPQGLGRSASLPSTMKWSLTRGCVDPQNAIVRAEALVGETLKSGVENGSFWRQQALAVTRALLQAGALDNRPPSDLYRWSHFAGAAKEAVTILSTNDGSTPGWGSALDAIISADQRTRDSVWAMVANTFAPLSDPSVLASVSPGENESFDPHTFLKENGTLFLLGSASGASSTSTLVAALIEDVINAARHEAAKCIGQRLDPPLSLVLDEAASYPLPSLPSLMSEGGGSGIMTLAVLQSLSQARDRWGIEAAGAIWDSAIIKIVLGGSSNADDLSDISRLIGDRELKEWSETRQGGLGYSMSSSTKRMPILEPSEIRKLPIGHGLLLLRASAPVIVRLQPWTKRKDRKELIASKLRFEETIDISEQSGANIGKKVQEHA